MKKISIISIVILSSLILIIFFSFNSKKESSVVKSESKIVSLKLYDHNSNQKDFYSEYEILKLPIGNLINSSGGVDVIYDDEMYIVSNFKNNNSLVIIDKKGNLVSSIEKFGNKNEKLNIPVGVRLDKVNQRILVGDSGTRKILYFDYQGNFIQEKNVGFDFKDFAFSPKEQKFIFHMPFSDNVINNNHALIITDDNFSIEKQLFPLPKFINKHPYIASNSLKVNEGQVFYNPPTTGKIYEIKFNGNNNLIIDVEDSKNIKLDPTINELENSESGTDAFLKYNQTASLIDFFINEKIIVANKLINKARYSIIIDRNSLDAVAILNRMRITKLEEPFKFIYNSPQISNNDKFLNYFSFDKINYISNEIGGIEKLDRNLSENAELSSNDFAIIRYNYNFDKIQKNSIDNIESLYQSKNIKSFDLEVYPSPAIDKINLKLVGENLKDNNIQINIFSQLGIQVYHKKTLYQESFEINLDNLPSGIYFIQTIIQGRKALSKTFIKG